MQETVKDAELKILQERLEAREKQLQQMAQLLADLNVQLSDIVESNENLKRNNRDLKERIQVKEYFTKQEIYENNVANEQIAKLEKENRMLQLKLERKARSYREESKPQYTFSDKELIDAFNMVIVDKCDKLPQVVEEGKINLQQEILNRISLNLSVS